MSDPGISVRGIVFIDTVGLGLIILIINLVRTRRLYVGYALLWLLALAGLMVIVSFPPLLALVTTAVGAIFPVSALTLLAFVFMFLVLVFMSVRLTVLSTRQIELIQALALKEVLTQEDPPGSRKLEGKNQKEKRHKEPRPNNPSPPCCRTVT